jgi:hypothetical protein
MQTDVRILGGLPVTIEFTMQGAEPDVGIMSDYVEEWFVSHINGKVCKKSPDWLYNRIQARKGEEDLILNACYEAAKGWQDDYYED